MSFNNSLINKFNEICRTCLKGGQLLTYLYDEENSINLVTKLITCTSIQFDKNDQMPNKICPTCIEELLQAYNFINKCQISDATLKKYFVNQPIKIEEDKANEPTLDNVDKEMKIEIEDEISPPPQIEDDDSISIKDEFLEKMNKLDDVGEVENNKKRKRQDDHHDDVDDVDDVDVDDDNDDTFHFTDCSVDLSAKKIATETNNVLANNVKLNHTFSVASTPENSNSSGRTKYMRRTRSEHGKENFAQQKTPRIKYNCPVCPKYVYSSMALLKHFQTHTATKNTPKLIEEICHKNSTSYTCEVCQEIFKKPERLINHYGQHINAIKCEFCDKLFIGPQMRKHVRVNHQGPHPFHCESCTKKFATLETKQLHIKQSHSEENPHKCGICAYTFKTLAELYSHEIEHVGAAPYKCSNCKVVFKEAHQLITHKVEKKCGRFYDCLDCDKVYQMIKDKKDHKLKEHHH